MPRYVALSDGDAELAVDLENMVSVDSVVELIKKRPDASFVELWPPPGRDGIPGAEGHFANEVIVAFVTKQPGPSVAVKRDPQSIEHQLSCPRRLHWVPGSEWLYLKLYAGESSVERLLREALEPPLDALRDDGSIDRWFFVRYGDPDWHLRLRLHGDPSRLRSEVLERVSLAARDMLDRGSISRFSLDTYEPELERYGGERGMLLSERLFWADSEAVLQVVAELLPAAGEGSRWKLAVLGIDRLLTDLGYDLQAKARLLAIFRDRSARRLDVKSDVERQLGNKYRANKGTVLELLTGESTDEHIAQGGRIFDSRSAAVSPIVAELSARAAQKQLTTDWDDLAASYVHMFCNRIFPGAAVRQEMVAYDLLSRAYRTLAVRREDARPGPR